MTDTAWADPIVDEVRRARDEYAASLDYDLERIFADIQDHQEERTARGGTVVSLPPKRVPVFATK